MRCESCDKFLKTCSPIDTSRCPQEKNFYVFPDSRPHDGYVIRARSMKQAKYRFAEMRGFVNLTALRVEEVIFSPKRQQWEDDQGIPTRHFK